MNGIGILIVALLAIGGVSCQINHATALLQIEGKGSEIGVVHFMQIGHTLRITGQLQGLPPGIHGFHVHEFGDVSDKCMSMGSHFNPENFDHGAPQDSIRHAGDLGNIEANNEGKAFVNITDAVLGAKTLASCIGRGLVLHEKIDDLGRGGNDGSKKTGNAGGRLACGPIVLAKPHVMPASMPATFRRRGNYNRRSQLIAY